MAEKQKIDLSRYKSNNSFGEIFSQIHNNTQIKFLNYKNFTTFIDFRKDFILKPHYYGSIKLDDTTTLYSNESHGKFLNIRNLNNEIIQNKNIYNKFCYKIDQMVDTSVLENQT
jgi:hypothetical protein